MQGCFLLAVGTFRLVGGAPIRRSSSVNISSHDLLDQAHVPCVMRRRCPIFGIDAAHLSYALSAAEECVHSGFRPRDRRRFATVGGWAENLDVWIELLCRSRPVFHSEADFQHALAWTAHLSDPSLRIRLETRSATGARLDLLISRPNAAEHLALELKYLTAAWTGDAEDEHFALLNQGAQDTVRTMLLRTYSAWSGLSTDGRGGAAPCSS
jgi:hypothetical protein